MASAAPARPAVALAGLSKAFATRGGHRARRCEDVSLAGRRRRGARARRPVGLRQVHAARDRLRPAGAVRRARSPSRAGRRPPSGSPLRADAAARPAAAVALGARQRRRWRSSCAARGGARRGARAAELFERFGLGEFARARPGRAVGRDAPARRVRAHAARRQAGAAAGRAVRVARRDHARRAAGVDWRERSPTEPRTVLLVTHDIEEALYLCDRVLVLSRAGRGRCGPSCPVPRAAPRPRSETVTSARVLRAARSARWRRSHERALAADWGPPLLLLALLVGGWELARARGLGRELPAARAERGRPRAGRGPATCCSPDAWVTAQEVLLGFALALAVGRRDRGRAAPLRPRCGAPSTRWWSPRRPCR